MRSLWIFASIVIIGTAASPADARQPGEMHFRFHGGLLFYKIDEPEGTKVSFANNFTVGGAFGYFVNGNFSVEGEVGYANGGGIDITVDDLDGQGEASWRNPSANMFQVNGNANLYMTDAPVTLYGSLGIGWTRFMAVDAQLVDGIVDGRRRTLTSLELPRADEFALNVGVGGDIGAIRVEYRHFFFLSSSDSSTIGRFSAGINFLPWE
jgi:hypothetical protein